MLKRIVVTGGSGFIGSELLNALLHANYDVLNIDLSNPHNDVRTSNISILNYDEMYRVIKAFESDAVIHLAGGTANTFNRDPYNFLHTYIKGTKNIVDISEKLNIKKLIFISSDHVYIHYDEKCTVNEDQKIKITYNPSELSNRLIFSMSKAISEETIINHLSNYVILRLSSVYGKGNCSNLISGMAKEAISSNEITVWGNKTRRVQFTFLDDVIKCIIGSLSLKTGIYNVSSDERVKLIDVAKKISDYYNIDYVIDKNKPSGPRFPYVLNKKIKKQLKDFKFTDFQTGLIDYLSQLK